jgi:UDP-N-acetylglucosamine--N-acetylmuramyl-(pentapeptide) pyrophosphoryl-undecaprenol N-acetylglucosamine transferase
VKVLFAGGGTGGHLYPALAIAEHLRRERHDFEALFLGSARGIEAHAVPAAGFALQCIPGSGFRRLGPVGRLKAIFSLLLGLWSALRIVHRFGPQVVVATGGWASLAGGLAAVLLRKPLLVQEQNSVPGFSNRLLGRWARQVHVAFPGTETAFAHPDRVALTGNPLRQALIQEARREPLPVAAGMPTTILVVGGSCGSCHQRA